MVAKKIESPVGRYKLTVDQITVRCGTETFTLMKGAKVVVEAEDPAHGNVLIFYGGNNHAWKHISVLKDFKRIK